MFLTSIIYHHAPLSILVNYSALRYKNQESNSIYSTLSNI
nr:MAG TPA: hypothetical protein [Caudoviricetes sp.]